jgi:putative MATE family efflux protein
MCLKKQLIVKKILKMQIKTTYCQILRLAAPLMLGSAGQNLMVACESAFLSWKSEADFAAIGYVGMFYLGIMAIAFGMSRGGQVLIARRMGEGNLEAVGKTFYALLYLELFMATIVFLFIQFLAPTFFHFIIKEPIIYDKTIEFLKYRSFGVFFSYAGLAIVAFYSGIARPTFIFYDTLILGFVNIILSYGLIFGKWGLPDMGIGGAALAGTIAEFFAFFAFLIYMYLDKETSKYKLFSPPKIDLGIMRQQFGLSVSTSAQTFISIASWFLFFMLVEKYMTIRDLAVSNLIRMLYFCLAVPSWGFFAAINTLVSKLIGQNAPQLVMDAIRKTTLISTVITLLLALPFVLFPVPILTPLLSGTEHSQVIQDAIPVINILLVNLIASSVCGVVFNALSGTGATVFGTKVQAVSTFVYLVYTWILVSQLHSGLTWAWLAEAMYSFLIAFWTISFLRSERWKALKI